MGRTVTADHLLWEWAEYQQAFTDLLQRYSAMLARQARAEKKRIERLAQADPSHREPPASPAGRKAALRRQIALFPSSEQTSHLPPPSSLRAPNGEASHQEEEEP